MIDLVIFDMDDTLIHTEPLYRAAMDAFGATIKKEGFNYEEGMKIRHKMEHELTRRMGASRDMFALSLEAAYSRLCEKHRKKSKAEVYAKLSEIGYSMFSQQATVFPFTKKVLVELASINKFVLTRGEQDIQLSRFIDSKLVNHFKGILVVERKLPETYWGICSLFKADPERSVMVGNSINHDLLPAMEAGLYGIHTPNGTIDYNQAPKADPNSYGKFIQLNTLEQLPKALEKIK
jgi:putative hydrolase of the HAD superfamily